MVELEKASREDIEKELKFRKEQERLNSVTWGVANILRLRKEDKIDHIGRARVPCGGTDHPEHRVDAIVVYLKHWVNES
jgi:hypothetical protein